MRLSCVHFPQYNCHCHAQYEHGPELFNLQTQTLSQCNKSDFAANPSICLCAVFIYDRYVVLLFLRIPGKSSFDNQQDLQMPFSSKNVALALMPCSFIMSGFCVAKPNGQLYGSHCSHCIYENMFATLRVVVGTIYGGL